MISTRENEKELLETISIFWKRLQMRFPESVRMVKNNFIRYCKLNWELATHKQHLCFIVDKLNDDGQLDQLKNDITNESRVIRQIISTDYNDDIDAFKDAAIPKQTITAFPGIYLQTGMSLAEKRFLTHNYESELQGAERGDPAHQFNIAKRYEEGLGFKTDITMAIKWYLRSALQGYSQAQHNLGFLYDKGYGVKEDAVEAFKWYLCAAKQGDMLAQNNLAMLYEDGRGAKKDIATAIYWYKQAAAQGYSSANNNLGNIYFHGIGIERDLVSAANCYKVAAEQGNSRCQFNYAVCLKEGLGVEKDLEKALEWCKLSYRAGFEKASILLNQIKHELQTIQSEINLKPRP